MTMRNVVISALLMISFGFLMVPAPSMAAAAQPCQCKGCGCKGGLGLARPGRDLRLSGETRRDLRQPSGHPVQAGSRTPRLLWQVLAPQGSI